MYGWSSWHGKTTMCKPNSLVPVAGKPDAAQPEVIQNTYTKEQQIASQQRSLRQLENRKIRHHRFTMKIDIHSFIHAISIAPLQVLYHSDTVSEFHAEAHRQL